MNDREELEALRRLAELEAKVGQGQPQASAPEPEIAPWKQAVSSIGETALPTLGALGGAIAATPGTLGLGTVAGGALGYAGGAQMSDLLKQYLGTTPKKNLTEQSLGALQDVKSGAEAGMLGEVGGVALQRLMPLARAEASKLYQSATKMSTTIRGQARKDIIEHGLSNKIYPTEGGAVKLKTMIEDVNDIVTNTVKGSKQPIKTADVANRLDALKDYYKNAPNPEEYYAVIDGVKEKYINAWGDVVTPEQAQATKRFIYKELKKSYGQLKSIDIESEKALARGLKEEVYKIFPELEPLGRKEGMDIRLLDTIEKAVSRIGNRNILSLGTGVSAAANPKMGLLYMLANNPRVNSFLAFRLHSMGLPEKEAARIVKMRMAAFGTAAVADEGEQ